jgi:hypothetical protein
MKRLVERRSGPLEVRTRFAPSRLAEVCLSDAYTRLVPPVRRPLGAPPHAQASRQQSQAERSCRERRRQEERPCS